MGLDVSFDLSKARKAGIVEFKYMSNGSPESIASAKEANEDPDYIAWLEEAPLHLRLATNDLFISNPFGWANCEVYGGDVIVRANKWGSLYAPLTERLQRAGITWSEG